MALRLRSASARRSLGAESLMFGGAPMGGLYTATSDSDAEAAVRCALELGVRAFDTAPQYGCGLGERRMGSALLAAVRSNVCALSDLYVATKVGRLVDTGACASADASVDTRHAVDVWPEVSKSTRLLLDYSAGEPTPGASAGRRSDAH
eukprot:TRINITY_DN3106_c0_g2_i1.p2 TRINITY_DN3106_c0_g2~~TRINITY_DN3106_c0_g2_i1.p2  ORF type:complete len:149 (+),score=22.88 TRINITY_DN3106_c0_g2_i1:41-487(+)